MISCWLYKILHSELIFACVHRKAYRAEREILLLNFQEDPETVSYLDMYTHYAQVKGPEQAEMYEDWGVVSQGGLPTKSQYSSQPQNSAYTLDEPSGSQKSDFCKRKKLSKKTSTFVPVLSGLSYTHFFCSSSFLFIIIVHTHIQKNSAEKSYQPRSKQ